MSVEGIRSEGQDRIRLESDRKVRTGSARNLGRDGKGLGEGFSEAPGTSAEQASRDAYFAAVEWAEANVPDEHPPFAAAAAMTLKHGRQGDEVTADEVRARLRSQGRSMEQLA